MYFMRGSRAALGQANGAREDTALLRNARTLSDKRVHHQPSRRTVFATAIATLAVVGTVGWSMLPADGDLVEYDEPKWWMRVELGDGRVMWGRAYKRFMERRLAEDIASSQAYAGNGTVPTMGDLDQVYDIDDNLADDSHSSQFDSSEFSQESLRLRIQADEDALKRLRDSKVEYESKLGSAAKATSTSFDSYGAGKDTAGAATSGASSTFCWKESYGRGVGTIPNACPEGKETIAGGALCYNKCSKYGDFKRVGYDCHQKCKSGWADHGLLCYNGGSSYGRGVGRIPKVSCSKKKKFFGKKICVGWSSSCGSDRPDKCIGLCYPNCRSGYRKIGCNICSMDCKQQGYAGGVPPSCPKRMYLSPGLEGAKCPSSKEKDGGLCYTRCRSNYKGVGPVCWGQPPSGWVNCGMGASTTSGECASVVMDQVMGPAEVAIFAATFGASSSAKATELQKEMEPDKVKEVHKVMDALVLFVKKVSRSKDAKKVTDAVEQILDPILSLLSGGSTLASSIITLKHSSSAVDTFRGVAELMSILDPSGVAATAAAYAHPKCDKV